MLKKDFFHFFFCQYVLLLIGFNQLLSIFFLLLFVGFSSHIYFYSSSFERERELHEQPCIFVGCYLLMEISLLINTHLCDVSFKIFVFNKFGVIVLHSHKTILKCMKMFEKFFYRCRFKYFNNFHAFIDVSHRQNFHLFTWN